ncbi:hypothetical protein V1478_006152 [Vespula squamosa]|uniref:Uncharacterized protein n=1 Tax=Vespula squamosa TaxID=30214 RepID=A0ABD2B731_VESSQ
MLTVWKNGDIIFDITFTASPGSNTFSRAVARFTMLFSIRNSHVAGCSIPAESTLTCLACCSPALRLARWKVIFDTERDEFQKVSSSRKSDTLLRNEECKDEDEDDEDEDDEDEDEDTNEDEDEDEDKYRSRGERGEEDTRHAYNVGVICAYTVPRSGQNRQLQINNPCYKAFGHGDIDYVPVVLPRRRYHVRRRDERSCTATFVQFVNLLNLRMSLSRHDSRLSKLT